MKSYGQELAEEISKTLFKKKEGKLPVELREICPTPDQNLRQIHSVRTGNPGMQDCIQPLINRNCL